MDPALRRSAAHKPSTWVGQPDPPYERRRAATEGPSRRGTCLDRLACLHSCTTSHHLARRVERGLGSRARKRHSPTPPGSADNRQSDIPGAPDPCFRSARSMAASESAALLRAESRAPRAAFAPLRAAHGSVVARLLRTTRRRGSRRRLLESVRPSRVPHLMWPSRRCGQYPCRRQADQVVAPGSTGRRLLVEDDHWRLRQDADIEQPDGVAGGVGGPSSSHRARMPGWSPLGVRSATLRTIKRRSTAAAGLRSLSPAVAVVGTRPDGALAVRPRRVPGERMARRSHLSRQGWRRGDEQAHVVRLRERGAWWRLVSGSDSATSATAAATRARARIPRSLRSRDARRARGCGAWSPRGRRAPSRCRSGPGSGA
jgi:hypothetical protein